MFQGDVCHIVGDIYARRITHDEKEKMQSEFATDSKFKASTLYRKKIDDIENRSLIDRRIKHNVVTTNSYQFVGSINFEGNPTTTGCEHHSCLILY